MCGVKSEEGKMEPKAITRKDMEDMAPLEFEEYANHLLGATPTQASHDWGIDGHLCHSFYALDGIPITVKKIAKRVSRKEIDEFASSCKRHYAKDKNKGKERIGIYISLYGFSSDAYRAVQELQGQGEDNIKIYMLDGDDLVGGKAIVYKKILRKNEPEKKNFDETYNIYYTEDEVGLAEEIIREQKTSIISRSVIRKHFSDKKTNVLLKVLKKRNFLSKEGKQYIYLDYQRKTCCLDKFY